MARRKQSDEEAASSYVIELTVPPGGSRWAEIHAYTEPAHVKVVLDRFCANRCDEAYLALARGATLAIWTVQRGVIATDWIDLREHIEARIAAAAPWAKLSEPKAFAGFVQEMTQAGEIQPFAAVELRLASWDALAERLPSLEAPLLARRTSTPAKFLKKPRGVRSWLGKRDVWFGSNELESGDRLEVVPGAW